ncbi:prolipoprotein diacylglyceryl transferase [Oceanobacillus indicireducens]|uniref:Phosphatidylglycerol--prolipoprotein diacylglyceryl transferase n=1 Tax=Oceanobacillus indicireducens TaxID=1004261 RepID=A0A917Y517_9BACI|nr:prolipoprotein diacylglyceryl transferase [Oceanobacillus indicireducens]GGN66669.1 prolipoprotein diacylglyceryl transferase [Oceanobacillus indicireducens]
MIYTVEPLDRVMLELGPFTIYWYGVIIAFGALLGIYLATREAERLGWNKDTIIDFVVYAIPIAIITARIFYVTFEWERYADGPFWKVFAIWEGGIAIHGAVLGGVLTAIVYTRVKKLSFWKLADIIAPSLILGQAIGRWGNFMNQEAHGGPVSEAAYNNFLQYLPDFIMNQMTIGGVMYHPTFLYESIWNILVFIFLLLLRKYNPTRGVIFLNYLIFYSVGRFFIESLRTDSLYIIEGLRTAQVVSVTLIVVGIILIIYRRRTEPVRYLDIPESKKSRKKKKKKR